MQMSEMSESNLKYKSMVQRGTTSAYLFHPDWTGCYHASSSDENCESECIRDLKSNEDKNTELMLSSVLSLIYCNKNRCKSYSAAFKHCSVLSDFPSSHGGLHFVRIPFHSILLFLVVISHNKCPILAMTLIEQCTS